jgi:putative membrane protein
MQPGSKKIFRFLGNWAINTLAVAVAAMILHGHISYGDKPENLLIASFLLGLLNAFIFTLGLFTLVINAVMLYFVGWLLAPYFQVDSFRYAFLGALIISIVSVALNVLTGNARVSVQRRKPPGPPPGGGGGNGPVIDV